MADPHAEMERLVFVRYLYRMGIEQAMQPEPMNAFAVLLLHDSVDLFLQVAADRVHAKTNPKKSPYRADYFDLIDAKLPAGSTLGHRPAMSRLKDTRNLCKHQGVRPSSPDVGALHGSVTRFLLDNTPPVFWMQFAEISMSRLVAAPVVRAHLENAERLAATADREGAVHASATAYAYLRRAYYPRRASEHSDLTTVRSLRHERDRNLRTLVRGIEQLTRSVEQLQNEVDRLSLDIDPAQMNRFARLTPSVMIAFAGNPQTVSSGNRHPPTDDDVRFCYEFVGLALRLQRRYQHRQQQP